MTAEELVPLDRLAQGIAQIINQARGQVRQFYLIFPKRDAVRSELS